MKSYLFGTMRTCFLTQLVLLLTVFFVSIPIIRADIITFQYEGELTEVDTELGGEFSVGDKFSGSYSFNTDSADPQYDDSIYFYPDWSFPNAISNMMISFSKDGIDYYTASATNGGIYEDFWDEPYYSIDIDSISGLSIESFVPDRLYLSWIVSGAEFFYDLMISPGFQPNISPIYINPYRDYYDAEGNLLYDDDNYVDLVYDPEQPLFYSDGSPARTQNGSFSFYFLNSDDQLSKIWGNLNSVTLSSNIPSISIPDNKWVQIGLNTTPPTGSTVADIIGDDISASYGSDWVLYSYQTSTNTYKQLNLTDTMHPGIGYWFIQVTDNPITIDMPNASTGVNVIQSPACPSFDGCFEIPLQTSNSVDTQWQMIGYPFRDNRNIDKVRVITRDVGSDCFVGCTLKEANEKGMVSEPMYHFDGTSYQQLTTEGSEPFKPWDGAWIATLPAASGQHPKLLIPATN